MNSLVSIDSETMVTARVHLLLSVVWEERKGEIGEGKGEEGGGKGGEMEGRWREMEKEREGSEKKGWMRNKVPSFRVASTGLKQMCNIVCNRNHNNSNQI